MDFKKATELFADKNFDGDPVIIYEPRIADPPIPPEDLDPNLNIDIEEDDKKGRIKYIVGDTIVYVMAERVQYYGAEGKLITESLKDYTKKTKTSKNHYFEITKN